MGTNLSELLEGTCDNYVFPFFWLHGESEETLRHYMDVIEKANCRAVCVESRPHPDFCGPGWWRDMDIILATYDRFWPTWPGGPNGSNVLMSQVQDVLNFFAERRQYSDEHVTRLLSLYR